MATTTNTKFELKTTKIEEEGYIVRDGAVVGKFANHGGKAFYAYDKGGMTLKDAEGNFIKGTKDEVIEALAAR